MCKTMHSNANFNISFLCVIICLFFKSSFIWKCVAFTKSFFYASVSWLIYWRGHNNGTNPFFISRLFMAINLYRKRFAVECFESHHIPCNDCRVLNQWQSLIVIWNHFRIRKLRLQFLLLKLETVNCYYLVYNIVTTIF